MLSIVPMREEHIAAIAALERACFAHPWSEKSLQEELENPQAVFRVAATSKNGRVEFERLEAITANFKTTNASIKGSFVGSQGDYNYRCTTTNGKSNLGESGGTGAQKQFYCATTNGNIDISFTQS